MKKLWIEKDKCTGCSACMNICPVGAITMKQDECGFIYPVINDKCINCNACEKVCVNRNHINNIHFLQPKTYATWSKNKEIRFNSTSGGLFSEIAFWVFSQGGYVVGAKYNSDNMVEHILIKDKNDLPLIRQSKYIQSNIGYVFQTIKKYLQEDKLIAFCGAPCQVAGLLAYLDKEYPNLITIDFICRGMNSPKAYLCWLKELEQKENSKAIKVWFKYKEGGWKSSPLRTRVDFKNEKYIVLENNENTFMKGYLGPNLYIRPSCGKCDFKDVPRLSDITLADFWGIEKEYDDDKGTSLALINSGKGEYIFKNISDNIIVYQKNYDDIFAGNICFKNSVDINNKSKQFLSSLDKIEFSKALKKYTKASFSRRVIGKCKRTIKNIIKK